MQKHWKRGPACAVLGTVIYVLDQDTINHLGLGTSVADNNAGPKWSATHFEEYYPCEKKMLEKEQAGWARLVCNLHGKPRGEGLLASDE